MNKELADLIKAVDKEPIGAVVATETAAGYRAPTYNKKAADESRKTLVSHGYKRTGVHKSFPNKNYTEHSYIHSGGKHAAILHPDGVVTHSPISKSGRPGKRTVVGPEKLANHLKTVHGETAATEKPANPTFKLSTEEENKKRQERLDALDKRLDSASVETAGSRTFSFRKTSEPYKHTVHHKTVGHIGSVKQTASLHYRAETPNGKNLGLHAHRDDAAKSLYAEHTKTHASVETAAGVDWWAKLGKAGQAAYLKDHPNSRMAKGHFNRVVTALRGHNDSISSHITADGKYDSPTWDKDEALKKHANQMSYFHQSMAQEHHKNAKELLKSLPKSAREPAAKMAGKHIRDSWLDTDIVKPTTMELAPISKKSPAKKATAPKTVAPKIVDWHHVSKEHKKKILEHSQAASGLHRAGLLGKMGEHVRARDAHIRAQKAADRIIHDIKSGLKPSSDQLDRASAASRVAHKRSAAIKTK